MLPGTTFYGKAEQAPLKIFGVDDRLSLPVVRLPPMADPASLGDGAVGWPAMRAHAWVLDSARNVYAMLAEVPEEARTWTRWELLDRPTLALRTRKDKITYRIYIDTGNPTGVRLPPSEWSQWKKTNPDAPITLSMGYFLGEGLRVTEESIASQLEIGGVTLARVSVGEASVAEYVKEGAGNDTVITLGLAALDALEVVLDPAQGAAFLRANASAPLPEHNRFGVAFSESGDRLVAHVAPRSPAAEAGLRSGDVLVQVDGRAVAGWRETPEHLRSLKLSAPVGTLKTFVVDRQGRQEKFSVRARNILPSP